jgi:lysophospholipase L1-like esterase
MNRTLLRRAIVTLGACGVLALVSINEPRASFLDPEVPWLHRVIRMMHDRNMTRDATDEEVAGYYEGLLAGRPATLLGRARDSESYRFLGNYLYYDAKPHLDIADYDDRTLRHVTNSLGMPDGEYPLERRPRTRRLAILGDSVTRGQGAPFGRSFEALLEVYLNEEYAGGDVDTYELLNFSSTGYRLTQIVDVALEKTPPFKPDVYVVCLTRLAVSRKWGDHVAQLVYDGIDLKYPFLRDLAVSARLDPRDPPATMDAKLASHRVPAIRWALATIQERARQDGAAVMVVLVPTATEPEALEAAFAGVGEVLEELRIPTLDLLDTFGGVDDLLPFMVEEGNVHPNEAGHQRIFEQARRRLQTEAVVRAVVLGPGVTGGGVAAP